MTNADVRRFADQAWFVITARTSIIFASVIGLPLCGWLLASTYLEVKEAGKVLPTIDLRLQNLEKATDASLPKVEADAAFKLRDFKDAEQDRRLDWHGAQLQELNRRLPTRSE